MSYDEFAKLKFLDFFPKTSVYSFDEVGGTTTGIGYACTDGYGPTFFASRSKSKGQTCEISLDFDNMCPEAEGHALLERLGLKLCRGMSYAQVTKILGVPEEDDPEFLRFIIGKAWPYYVGCSIDEKGLYRVWICRKDLADKNIL